MNFCPKCGAKLEGNFAFCPECGNSLTAPETNAGASAYTEPAQAAEPAAYTEPVQPAGYTAYTEPVQPAGYTVNAPGTQAAPAQNKKKLGIIIGAAVALVLILVIVLASCAGGGSSMDKEDMQSFTFRSLTCYVPMDWEFFDYDDTMTGYISSEYSDVDCLYLISDTDSYDAEEFAEAYETVAPEQGSFTEISIPCADEAYIASGMSTDGDLVYNCFFSCGGNVYGATLFSFDSQDCYDLFMDLLYTIEY